MKFLIAGLLLVALPGVAQPQTSSANQTKPALEVIRFSWSKVSQSGGLESGYNAGSPKPQNTPQIDRQLEILRQNTPENKQTIDDLELKKKQPASIIKPRNKRPEGKAKYQYAIEIKNSAAQQVVEIAWEYVFADPKTQQESLRHSFVSKAKIKPGGKKRITVISDKAPLQVVDVSATSNQERVIVKRITYTDGSVWKE